MSVEADFSTLDEARQAYYEAAGIDTSGGGSGGDGSDGDGSGSGGSGGGSGGDSNNDGSSGTWGEIQEKPAEFLGGWVLLYQDNLDTNERRWWVFRAVSEGWQALGNNGGVETYPENTEFGMMVSHTSEESARNAYQAWVGDDSNGQDDDGSGDDDSGGDSGKIKWTEWGDPIDQIDGWHIYERHRVDDDSTQQYIVGGLNSEGTEIFLAPEGKVVEEPHIYESKDAARSAITAFQDRANRGETNPNNTPSGGRPSGDGFPDRRSGGGGIIGSAASAVGGRRNLLLLIVAAAVVVYYLDETGQIDISSWLDGGGVDG